MAKPEPKKGDESTALVRLDDAYPALAGGAALEEVREAIAANLGGQEVRSFDLDKVRVPTGGMLMWEVTTGPDEKEYPSFVEGIIVLTKMGRSYWSQAFGSGGGSAPPDCTSVDLVHGVGDPGGECEKCPFNEFGTAVDAHGNTGRGKACKEIRFVFLLREGSFLPMVMTVPVTSLKRMKQWLLQAGMKGRPYWSFVARFELVEAKNSDGVKYAAIKPSIVRMLTPEEIAQVKAYAEQTRETFAQYNEGVSPTDVAAEEELITVESTPVDETVTPDSIPAQ